MNIEPENWHAQRVAQTDEEIRKAAQRDAENARRFRFLVERFNGTKTSQAERIMADLLGLDEGERGDDFDFAVLVDRAMQRGA